MSMPFATIVVLFRRNLWIKASRNGVDGGKQMRGICSMISRWHPGRSRLVARYLQQQCGLIGECFRGK
jgi:uncharacterized protein (DUF2235 family)